MLHRGENGRVIAKWFTVETLQRLLTVLQPTDEIHTRTMAGTGNLPIVRNGLQMGVLDTETDHIEWWIDPEFEKGGETDGTRGEGGAGRGEPSASG